MKHDLYKRKSPAKFRYMFSFWVSKFYMQSHADINDKIKLVISLFQILPYCQIELILYQP